MLAFVIPIGSVVSDLSDGEIAASVNGVGPEAQAAESALCRRFGPRIRLYGLRHLGDEQSAADLVQLVLLRVLEALRAGRVENRDSLGSFVLGTCRYVAWDMRRAERRQRAIEAESLALHHDVLPPKWSEADVLRLLGCLQRLPERDSQIVRMTFMEDRTADEIGERLGLTAGNVRVARHRALARVYDCVEKGGSS
jgi:RNA polymerase sigma-70 factor (ECF subfamily)